MANKYEIVLIHVTQAYDYYYIVYQVGLLSYHSSAPQVAQLLVD